MFIFPCQGAGGDREQTHVYLEPGIVAAYRSLCRTGLPTAWLRSLMPRAKTAR